MLQQQRLDMIKNYVNQHRFASYSDLMQLLDASKTTVRRDLEKLASTDCLIMVRGGAASKGSTLMSELDYEQKQHAYSTEKNRMAQRAAELIKPKDTVILDAGTTVRKLVPFLADIDGLHVITCDVAIATDLSYLSNITVTVVGGTLRQGYFNTSGYFSETQMEHFRADIAFLSFDTISGKGKKGMITNVDEVGIKQKIISITDYKVALCDHSKYGRESVVSVCGLQDLDLFITGEELPPHVLEQFSAIEEQLILV